MIANLEKDQFGLHHAEIPHPDGTRIVHIMILKSGEGWWAYVDGDRLERTYFSRRSAFTAAKHVVTNPGSLTDREKNQPANLLRDYCTNSPVAKTVAFLLVLAAAFLAVTLVPDRTDVASSATATVARPGNSSETSRIVEDVIRASRSETPIVKPSDGSGYGNDVDLETLYRATSVHIAPEPERIRQRRRKRTIRRKSRRQPVSIFDMGTDIPMPAQH